MSALAVGDHPVRSVVLEPKSCIVPTPDANTYFKFCLILCREISAASRSTGGACFVIFKYLTNSIIAEASNKKLDKVHSEEKI